METPDRPDTRDDSAVPPRKLVEYDRYDDAQEAVDKLSDEGFPVEHVSIVWSRLRQIEYVTGRRTIATAAVHGALTGLWFGALIGLALSVWGDPEEDVTTFEVIAGFALYGAVIVAAYQAFRHWAQRGRRDFSVKGKLDAEAYEVWVHPGHIYTAAATLGITVPDDEPSPEATDGS